MIKGYYIYNPFLDIKDYVTVSKLNMITNMKDQELYNVINNKRFIKWLGYILPHDTPKTVFKGLEKRRYWSRVVMPYKCDYEISNYGEVRKIHSDGKRGRNLVPKLNVAESRYYVRLVLEHGIYNLYLDAAVARHFLSAKSNPYNTVEYIDGDCSNLYYKNLRSVPNKKAEDEVWKKIEEEGPKYEISNYGRVRTVINCKYKYIKAVPKGNSDSLSISLSCDGVKKYYSVSRLVAKYYLDDFCEDKSVSFKDNDKMNLYYKNLEIVSKEELGRRTGVLARKLPLVSCIEKESGKKIGTYVSAREASRELGINRQSISDNLNGKSKLVARKYIFRYVA